MDQAPRMNDSGHAMNVGQGERLASLVGGGMLTVLGLRRPTLLGAAMALAGGALVARGLTGYCPAKDMLGLGGEPDRDDAPAEDVDPGRHPYSRHPGDIYAEPENKEPVDEASQESFPASDPPSFSPGVAR